MSDQDAPTQPHLPPAVGGRLDREMPSFVVIGAQKSASTFLQDQLSLHPDVEIPEGEVRHFEDPFFADGAVKDLPRLYRRPASDAVRGIKRPDYLGRPEIPARLQAHLPDARLLVVLRDPVARAVSSYYHFVRHGFVPLRPIDDAFRALLSGQWEASHPRAREVLTFGRYGEHLQRYLDLFPSERLMVFDQGELIEQPQAAVGRAFAFIGVDPGFPLPEETLRVSNKGVYAPYRLRLLRTKNRTRFRYTDSMDRRYPKPMTPWGWVYNASVVGLDRTVLARFDTGRPPALSADVRAELDHYYASDLDLLRDVLVGLGVDQPAWLAIPK